MLFCHKIHYIWVINTLLSQNLVVEIYALFPPIFLGGQIVSAIIFAFWMYDKDLQKMKLNTNQLGQSCTAAQVKQTSCGPSLVVIKEFKTSALVTDCHEDEDVRNFSLSN